MKTIYLNIADFRVKLALDANLFDLPVNYRPFVADSPQDESDLLLTMSVSADAIDTAGAKLLGSFDDLGYRQDVFERSAEGSLASESGGETSEHGYIFQIYSCDGQLAATMESAPRFGSNRVCLHAQDKAVMNFGFSNAMMIAYAFSSAYRATLMMHSSVVAKDGKAYMFLGKSGTGKSTHSSLWLRHLDGYHLLNDDNPVLRVRDGKVIVYGSPWSGKTPCYRQESAEVGALVMLEQKPYNKISRESVVVALSSLLCSVSIMIWDRSSYSEIMRTLEQVITLRGVYHLECLPDEAAAQLSHQTITAHK